MKLGTIFCLCVWISLKWENDVREGYWEGYAAWFSLVKVSILMVVKCLPGIEKRGRHLQKLYESTYWMILCLAVDQLTQNTAHFVALGVVRSSKRRRWRSNKRFASGWNSCELLNIGQQMFANQLIMKLEVMYVFHLAKSWGDGNLSIFWSSMIRLILVNG